MDSRKAEAAAAILASRGSRFDLQASAANFKPRPSQRTEEEKKAEEKKEQELRQAQQGREGRGEQAGRQQQQQAGSLSITQRAALERELAGMDSKSALSGLRAGPKGSRRREQEAKRSAEIRSQLQRDDQLKAESVARMRKQQAAARAQAAQRGDESQHADEAEEDEETEEASAPEPPPATGGVMTDRAAFEAERRQRRFSLRKRPQNFPFNPLPYSYGFDEEADAPPESLMDRALFEQLEDHEQLRVRRHQGLIRLRRNEQKLQRILQMQRPDKMDLLMLLNEVEAAGGQDRPLFERYVGPRLPIEQLEDDVDAAFTFAPFDRDDVGEVVGDSRDYDIMTQAREEEREALRLEQEEKEKQAARSVAEIVPSRRKSPFPAQDPRDRKLKEEFAALQQRTREEASRVTHREPLMAEDAEAEYVEELKTRFPDGWDERDDQDELLPPEDDKEAEMEAELMLDQQLQAAGSQQPWTEAEWAELRVQAEKAVAAAKDEPTLQALMGGAEGMRLAEDMSAGREDGDYRARLIASITADQRELAVLTEHSGVWRVKQEMVASLRAALKDAGRELDESLVDSLMQEDEDGVESVLRADDEAELNTAAETEVVQRKLEKEVRRQRRWLTGLRQEMGDDAVKQLIASGGIELKTFGSLRSALWHQAQGELMSRIGQLAEMRSFLELQLRDLDTDVGVLLGISTADARSLIEGGVQAYSVKLPSEEDRQRLEREAQTKQLAAMQRNWGDILDSVLTRNLEREAKMAEAEGDRLAARKLRLMHSRRMQYEASGGSGEEGSSAGRDRLRGMGRILERGGEAEEGSGSYAIQRLQFGQLSGEEAAVNRQLIARGDGDNARFVDEDVHAEGAKFDTVTESLLDAPDEEDDSKDQQRLSGGAGDDKDAGTENEGPPKPARRPARRPAAADAGGLAEAHVQQSNAAQAEWSALTVEQRVQRSGAEEEASREYWEEFDDMVLSEVPLALHKKAVREFNKLSPADQAACVAQGRENRLQLRDWMLERLLQQDGEGVQIDPLSQYLIDEADPKLYNVIEGAFWHVGRWGLDERTEEQRRAGEGRQIVQRHAPRTPDTQTLLDETEQDLFGIGPDDDIEETLSEEDLSEEEKNVWRSRVRAERQAKGQLKPEELSKPIAVAETKQAELQSTARQQDEGQVSKGAAGEEEDEERAAQRFDRRDYFDLYDEDEVDPDWDDSEPQTQEYDNTQQSGQEDGEEVSEPELDEEELLTKEEAAPGLEPGAGAEPPPLPRWMAEDRDFNPYLVMKERRLEQRQLRFQDTETVPSADTRAFDDLYFHYDEEDYYMTAQADPYGFASGTKYRPPQSLQTSWSDYQQEWITGQNYLSLDTRARLYLLHKSNPSVWTAAALAMRFRISHAHVKGLLAIEAAEERDKEFGMEEEDDEALMSEAELRGEDVAGVLAAKDRIKHRERQIRRGELGRIIPLDQQEGISNEHPEEMLHMPPELQRPVVPDVRFVNENEVAAVLQEERDLEERFLSRQQRLARRESEYAKREGGIGTPNHPTFSRKADPSDAYQHPSVLPEGGLLPPLNYHLVCTDITEKARDRYSMVVRDVTGLLRQPTPVEFFTTRRKEKSDKGRFVYTEFKLDSSCSGNTSNSSAARSETAAGRSTAA